MEKILIVDDTKIIREGMIFILKDAFGCEVDEACDGVEALAKLAISNYSVVLMDFEMPVMNGFECVAKVRDLEKISGVHTPIICMTGSQERNIRERCIEAGMDGYLSKECSNQEIIETLRKCFVQQLSPGAWAISRGASHKVP